MFLEDTSKAAHSVGWIEVICGSMFSGKTEELIRRLKRAKIANQKVLIFKPKVDTRYHEEHVVSHDANKIPSIPVEDAAEILDLCKDCDVVGIDEGQFFGDNLPDICNQLANRGHRVLVAGLDMDYLGRPFGPMPDLLAIAEYVTKVHAVCVRTGKLANFSHRVTASDDLVKLGEKDHYEPLSRKAFIKALQEEEEKKKAKS